jgi:hypothetical protein
MEERYSLFCKGRKLHAQHAYDAYAYLPQKLILKNIFGLDLLTRFVR